MLVMCCRLLYLQHVLAPHHFLDILPISNWTMRISQTTSPFLFFAPFNGPNREEATIIMKHLISHEHSFPFEFKKLDSIVIAPAGQWYLDDRRGLNSSGHNAHCAVLKSTTSPGTRPVNRRKHIETPVQPHYLGPLDGNCCPFQGSAGWWKAF